MSDNRPVGEKADAPRFNRETRVRIALAKSHGLDGEEWTHAEIAEYLNVSERQVNSYLNESEMAEDMNRMLAQRQATTRLQLVEQLQNKLQRLEKVEQQLSQEVDAVPSRYRMESAVAEVDVSEHDGLEQIENPSEVEVDVPVPDAFAEVPNVEELSDVWRERRLVQEQLEDLLGLEEPEKLQTEQQKTVDIKHWDMSGTSEESLPDQEVIDVESERVDAEADGDR